MKKILILLLLVAPLSMLAQQKFGYVNSSEIMQLMPEFSKAQKELQELEKMYTTEYNSLRTELEKQGAEFEKMQKVYQAILADDVAFLNECLAERIEITQSTCQSFFRRFPSNR